MNVSNAQTHISINANTDDILDDVEEISPPRQSGGRDNARRVEKHAEEVEAKARYMVDMKTKSEEHNLLQKTFKCQHLEFLERNVREEMELREQELMTNHLTTLRTNEEDLSLRALGVLKAMNDRIVNKYMH